MMNAYTLRGYTRFDIGRHDRVKVVGGKFLCRFATVLDTDGEYCLLQSEGCQEKAIHSVDDVIPVDNEGRRMKAYFQV